LLAGVDVVVMGAGVPSAIPEAIERLCQWRPAELSLALENGSADSAQRLLFDPRATFGEPLTELRRPSFFAVVSSHVLAKVLIKKTRERVDGFIVEDHTAGGHNAPPRKARDAPGSSLSAFGPRDVPQLEELRALGLPFWVAGSAASPERLAWALQSGANGVQLGTAFAFCEESGMAPEIKADVIARALSGRARVVTDFEASPTGYPFKRVERPELPAELDALRGRERVCDLGYLRRAFRDEHGAIGYRCPGEPVSSYVKKGGAASETVNKLCLCNQLFATIGLGQVRARGRELPLITAGEELSALSRFVAPGRTSYTARDVVELMLGAPRRRYSSGSASLPLRPWRQRSES
jgi:nitronate monooxygenase